MTKRLLSGGEAITHAALAAGASVIAGYPTDALAQLVEAALRQTSRGNADDAHAQWTINNKTTLGICAATSISGFRSLAAFSQTGFSETIQGIAALTHSGIQGGLVVVVADEPDSDAFTTNLDVRRISELAKIPVLDPSTPEEAYTSVSAAFILSESYSTPVVIHVASDINYSSTFFDIHPHTKATPRRGSFFKDRESLDVADLLVEEPQDYLDVMSKDISSMDIRLNEIAYKFAYKDIFATYNRIREFEQQYEGKHNSKRFTSKKDRPEDDDRDSRSSMRIDPLDESNMKIGICVCGAAAPYAIEAIETLRREAHKSRVSTPYIRLLTLGTPFPVPKRTLRKFLDGLNDILVIEEFSSFAEEELIKQCATSFLGPSVHGRFTDEVNYNYAINFETTIMHIAAFIDKCLNVKPEKDLFESGSEPDLAPITSLGKHSSPQDASRTLIPKQSRTLTGIARRLASPESIYTYNSDIPERVPVLCSGCPHRASFHTIDKALERLKISRKDVVISGDIGCSILGNNPPLNFLDAYLGEGFSTSMAQGFSYSLPPSTSGAKSIAILGDSELFANAIPSITNAVVNNMDVTIIVLDNKVCAESGLQPTPTTFGAVDAASVLRSLGVMNVREASPFEISNAVDSCVKALRDTRPSAVVLSSKCARLVPSGKVAYVNTNKCTGCKDCISTLGCPAISFDKDIIGKKSGDLGQAVIDIHQCNGCRLCIHACPSEAIRIMQHKDVVELIKKEQAKGAELAPERIFANDGEEASGEPAEDVSENVAQVDEPQLDFSTSGPLLMLDDDEDDIEDKEVSSAKKARPRKVSKKVASADFGSLFGGRNAELRLGFDDNGNVLEDAFATDVEDDDEDVDGEREIADDSETVQHEAAEEADSQETAGTSSEDDPDDGALDEQAPEHDTGDAEDEAESPDSAQNQQDDDGESRHPQDLDEGPEDDEDVVTEDDGDAR